MKYPCNDIPLCRRRQIETLLARGACFGAEDKALLRMVLKEGITLRHIAHLTGKNPSTLSRRFRRLLVRLIGHRSGLASQRRGSEGHSDNRIMREYLLYGRSQKTIAQQCDTSLYRVRRTLRAVRSNKSRYPSARTHSHGPLRRHCVYRNHFNERSKLCTH